MKLEVITWKESITFLFSFIFHKKPHILTWEFIPWFCWWRLVLNDVKARKKSVGNNIIIKIILSFDFIFFYCMKLSYFNLTLKIAYHFSISLTDFFCYKQGKVLKENILYFALKIWTLVEQKKIVAWIKVNLCLFTYLLRIYFL